MVFCVVGQFFECKSGYENTFQTLFIALKCKQGALARFLCCPRFSGTTKLVQICYALQSWSVEQSFFFGNSTRCEILF